MHKGVKLISLATSIRWTSWSLIDPIMPVFLYSFGDSFIGAGSLKAAYSIIFVLTLPIAGLLANKVSAKYLILFALCIYPFISISYYLGAVLGVVWFVLIARVLNAFNYAFDSTGRATYFRRHMKNNSGKAFGYFESITSAWHLVPVAAGVFIADYVPIEYLFLSIIPTVFIAIFIIWKIPKDKADIKNTNWKKHVNFKAFGSSIREFRLWSIKLKSIAIISFLSAFAFTITDFFIPLKVYFQEGSLKHVFLLAGVMAIPGLFGYKIAQFIEKSKSKILFRSLFVAALAMAGLAFSENYVLQLFLIFIINVCAIAVSIFIDNESTLLGDNKKYGTISSLFAEIGAFSGILGPLIFGALTDFAGMNTTIIVGAFILFAIALFSSSGTLLNLVRKTREV